MDWISLSFRDWRSTRLDDDWDTGEGTTIATSVEQKRQHVNSVGLHQKPVSLERNRRN